jgi:hypothetical protein
MCISHVSKKKTRKYATKASRTIFCFVCCSQPISAIVAWNKVRKTIHWNVGRRLLQCPYYRIRQVPVKKKIQQRSSVSPFPAASKQQVHRGRYAGTLPYRRKQHMLQPAGRLHARCLSGPPPLSPFSIHAAVCRCKLVGVLAYWELPEQWTGRKRLSLSVKNVNRSHGQGSHSAVQSESLTKDEGSSEASTFLLASPDNI